MIKRPISHNVSQRVIASLANVMFLTFGTGTHNTLCFIINISPMHASTMNVSDYCLVSIMSKGMCFSKYSVSLFFRRSHVIGAFIFSFYQFCSNPVKVDTNGLTCQEAYSIYQGYGLHQNQSQEVSQSSRSS